MKWGILLYLCYSLSRVGDNEVYSRIMNRNDRSIENKLYDGDKLFDKDDPNYKMDQLEDQADELKKILDNQKIYPITSNSFWEKLHDHIIENKEKYFFGTQFKFEFSVRYNFCLLVVPLVEIQNMIVFPAKYKFLIPREILKLDYVSSYLKGVDNVLSKIQKKSKQQLLINLTLRRSLNIDDLNILKKLPSDIFKNPEKIIKWLSEFSASVE